MADDATLQSLRTALLVSPENVPLRALVAETLLGLGRAAEAEKEYRHALGLDPQSVSLKLGLVRAFRAQGESAKALVVAEDVAGGPDAPAGALVLLARLLLEADDVVAAARAYRRAVAIDQAMREPELDVALGVPAPEPEPRVPVAALDSEEPEAPLVPLERPGVTFADIGGMEPIKQEIRLKTLAPLQHPEIYRAYGKAIGGGILLYGPPGCGKTHLARATAGEVGASFLAVGLHEILDMWLGQSERNLHAVFEQARAQAPCVLFFDEVDALGASRSEMRHSGGRMIINQFLAELDGLQASNEGVLILAATNAPWHLDAAFRRPGRFDRVLFVPPPDAPARAAILRLLLAGKPVEAIEHEAVARKTEHYSGADLKAVVDRAIEAKLDEAIRRGYPSPLRTKDLLEAVKRQGATTREWFSSARNFALYANEGGAYDEVLAYLKKL